MNFSRRDILKGAAATLVTGVSSLAIAPALRPTDAAGETIAPVTAVAELSRQSFLAAVGSDFDVHVSATQRVTVRLRSLTDLAPVAGAPAPAPGKEGFTLLFTGARRDSFPQGTYTIDHPTLGSFALLLVATGPLGSGDGYEAVINRLWP
jgi:hypothetical protein